MTTGNAIVLVFALGFGWRLYSEHQAKMQKEEEQRWSDYRNCVNDYPPEAVVKAAEEYCLTPGVK